MDFNALSAGLSAAAPGAAQGIQNIQTGQAQKAVNQQAPAMANQAVQELSNSPQMQVQPLTQGQLQDPSHPFWQVMQSVAGGGGGGAIPTQSAPSGAIPAQQPAQQGLQAGGVVAPPTGVQPEFTRGPAVPVGPNSGIVPASTQGQVLTMEGGGPVPFQQASGISVPMTGPAAGFAQGMAQGQTLGHNLFEAFQAHEQRKAATEGASASLMDPEDAQGAQTQQPSMIDKARDAVEGFFHHLHEGTLNDQHTAHGEAPPIPPTGAAPGAAPQPAAAAPATGQQAIPAASPTAGAPPPPGGVPPGAAGAAPPAAPAPPATPQQAQAATQKVATGVAAATASQDAQSNAGIPQETPAESGKPHSLTADYWEQSNKKIKEAVIHAAAAGEDPQKVYNSLTTMRTAHFQGQILRQLSAANTALMNGDEASVKQALSNVNYYLPNGKGITFKTATAQDAAADKTGQTQAGQLLYRNPMAGLYGHQGEPEFVSVTPQHIQLLGAAALDPQTVQSTMLKTYSAQAQAQKEMLSAQGEFMTGEGRRAWGQAAADKITLDKQMLPVKKYLMFATGEKNEAQAGYYNRKQDKGATGIGPKITMASVQKAQTEGMNQFDNMSRGMTSVTPVIDPKTGLTNPGGGKNYNDSTKIPSMFQGMQPDQLAAGRALSASFAAANVGTMSGSEAAELAARVVRAEGAKVPQTHLDPTSKKVVRDVIYDPSNNSVHVWVGNGWKNAYIQPNVIDAGESQGIPTGGDDDAGASAEDNEPAQDSQNMN